MSYSMGGLIFRNGALVEDITMLTTVHRDQFSYSDNVTMEAATSRYFEGTAIARINNIAFIFNMDIPYTCSYEKDKQTTLDERLATLSKEGDILSFLFDGISGTYAWSLFREGKRTSGCMAAEGNVISRFGKPPIDDEKLSMDEDGMFDLIEQFTGYYLPDLRFDAPVKVTAYYK